MCVGRASSLHLENGPEDGGTLSFTFGRSVGRVRPRKPDTPRVINGKAAGILLGAERAMPSLGDMTCRVLAFGQIVPIQSSPYGQVHLHRSNGRSGDSRPVQDYGAPD